MQRRATPCLKNVRVEFPAPAGVFRNPWAGRRARKFSALAADAGTGAHDLAGALLPHMTANLLIADRAFEADRRVLDPLAAAGKSAVIPPRPNRLAPREFNRELYKVVREESRNR